MRYIALVASIVFAFGCGKAKPKAEADPNFDKYVEGTKAKLGKLDKIKAAVDAAVVTDEKLDPAATKGNYAVLAGDQLDKLGPCFNDLNVCGPEFELLSNCKADTKKSAQEAAGDATERLKACSELELLAVVRKVGFTKPTADMASKTYSPGELAGEVLVFDIDSAKYLGGFKVNAKTPDSLDKVPQGLDVDKALLQTVSQSLSEAIKLKLGSSRR